MTIEFVSQFNSLTYNKFIPNYLNSPCKNFLIFVDLFDNKFAQSYLKNNLTKFVLSIELVSLFSLSI
jgi:hypothetical protein